MKDRTQPGLIIDCAELVELVTDYLDGVLQPPLVAEVEAHLAICPGCHVYVEQMRQTLRTLGHVPVESLSSEARATLMSAFRDFHGHPA